MSKLIILLLLMLSMNVEGQVVTIPDWNFKNYLLNHPGINTNGDNEIQVSEAAVFTDSILCFNLGIQDITGIAAFTNLTFLNVALNNISTIDVSQNTELRALIFPMNNVSSLDVGTNTQLEELVCWDNQLTSIDVTGNPILRRLEFPSNSVTSLDLSQNPDLERLMCSGNSIGSLDLSIHQYLDYLECNGCGLSSIDLTNNPYLKVALFDINNISSFDLTQNPLLERFHCAFNNMTSLDLSSNVNLTSFGCFAADNLVNLNIQNGNNSNFTSFQANNCANLICVQVDDVAYSVTNWTSIDNSSFYQTTSCTSSLGEKVLSHVSCYPNPFSNEFTVESEAPIERVHVYSADGKCVLESLSGGSKNSLKIDGSTFDSGIYTVKVIHEGDQNVSITRIVK